MIQFADVKVSYKQFVDDVAKAVAKKLRRDMKAHDRLLTTNEAAAVLGITPGYLRHNKDKYTCEKRGEGKQARLMWKID